MKLFNIFPHTAYLNTEVCLFSDFNDDIEVVNASTGKSVKLSKNNHIHLKLPAGENIFKCKYQEVEQEEKIFVEDAIKLGGSTIKDIYLFEESPWILVIMKDRTYFHNRITGMEFMEHKFTPDEVSVISEDYLLMTSQNEQTIFSMQLMKPLLTFKDKLFLDETHVVVDETETESDYKIKKQVSVYAYKENYSDEKYKMTLSCEDYLVDPENKIIYTFEDGTFYSFLLCNSLKSEIKKDYRTFICFTQNHFVILQNKSFNKELFICDLEKNKELPILPEYRYPIISINDKEIEDAQENVEEYNETYNNIVDNIKGGFRAIEISKTFLHLNIWIQNDFVYYLIEKQRKTTNKYGKIQYENNYILGCKATSYEETISGNPLNDTYFNDDKLIVEFRYETIVLKDGNKLYSLIGGKLYKTPTTFVYHKKLEGIDHIYNLESKLIYRGKCDLRFVNKYNILIEEKEDEFSYFYQSDLNFSYFNCRVTDILENKNHLKIYSLNDEHSTIYINGKILQSKNNKFSEWISNNGLYYIINSNNKLLLFSRDNSKNGFIECEILSSLFETKFFTNAYFADGGSSLIYEQKGIDEYVYFDFNNNEEILFSTGKFIQNTNGYRPLVEFDKYRKPVIIDPVTLKKAPSAYLTDYNFISPDGRYRVDQTTDKKYYDKNSNEYISYQKYRELKDNYDFILFKKYTKEEKEKIISRREEYIKEHRIKIGADIIKSIFQFVDTNIIIEHLNVFDSITNETINVKIGTPLWFLNYVSFSYDNKYLAIAGRYPKDSSKGGLFLLYDLDNKAEVYKSENTYAVWITVFNKQNKVAFYTSEPNTYLEHVTKIKSLNVKYPTISNKSFLCFSPNGNYYALSIQGYIAKNSWKDIREYWGHQPSSDVFIHSIENNKELMHFNDFGGDIKGVKTSANNIAYASFSNDEKKFLSVSDDGVILIRNLNLKIENSK